MREYNKNLICWNSGGGPISGLKGKIKGVELNFLNNLIVGLPTPCLFTNMTKKDLKELGDKLKKTKEAIEAELQRFAERDPRVKGDWDTKFPHFDGGGGHAGLETAADEVEEYQSRLPVEFSLELRLKDIDAALEQIKKGNYGKCRNCGKEIEKKRLDICPEAKFCLGCNKK